eukprot:576572-Pleurochrysis_carterae.AAC.1
MLAHRPSHRVHQQRPRSVARPPLLRQAPLLERAALSSGSLPGARAPRDLHGCLQFRGSRHSCAHQHNCLRRSCPTASTLPLRPPWGPPMILFSSSPSCTICNTAEPRNNSQLPAPLSPRLPNATSEPFSGF